MKNFENIGQWWSNSSIDLVSIEGDVYALGGWNGEKYNNCWVCTGEFNMDASEEEYHVTPIYNDNEDDPEVIRYKVL